MADRYWVTGGTGVWSSTTNWSTSSGGASGASVPGSADNVIFDRASTYTVSITTGSSCLSFTASAGSPTFTMTNTLSIGGNFNLTGSTTTWTASTSGLFFQNQAGGGATRTINSAGVTIDCPVTVSDNVASTVQLAANFTIGSTRTFFFSAGVAGDILDLNGFTLSCGVFDSSNAITRTLAFGTGKIVCAATGTVWNMATVTGLTVTGTSRVEFTYSGATSMTVQNGALSSANAISFYFQAGSYSLAFGGTTIRNLDFTGSGATVATGTLTVYGNLTLGNTTTWSANGTLLLFGNLTLGTSATWTTNSTLNFSATSGTQVVTSNSRTIDAPVGVNGAGGTVQLFDDMTVGSTRSFTQAAATLDLNGKKLTTGTFTSSIAVTRTIAFGTGNITCTAAGGTLWSTSIVTGLTITGTPVVNISNSGSLSTTVTPGILTEANSISFNFTTGTYALSFLGIASNSARNVDFTGFSGTWNGNAAVAVTIYGGLTLSSTMTITAATGVLTFGGTSGTKIITSNAKTLDVPVTFSGIGSTFQLADAMNIGATKALLIQNGTLDGNNKTISGASSFSSTLSGGTPFIKNISTALAFTITSTTNVLTQSGQNTFGDVTYSGGTLALGSYTLYCNSFISSTGARTIAFGTGNITCTGTTGTLFAFTPSTSTVTGTPVVNIPYTGANAISVFCGASTEAQSMSFNFQGGTYPLTFLAGGTGAKNVDFTGYSGTWTHTGSGTCTIYGNCTLSSTMTMAVSTTPTLLFQSTSTQTSTSNGQSFVLPIGINGVGGTMRLVDAMTLLSTSLFTLTNGTFDFNGKTLTVGTQFATGVGTKNLTFNGGTLICPTASTTAFNNANPTNFTTTAGTGTGKISMTGATAKTFVGGGSTFNCTLSNDGAGTLTVSGSNTFTTIANGVQPTSFTFTAGTTQTVTNWNVSGTAGNLVTIISSTAGVPALLSKASGTVSSNYLSLKDSTATGGAAWYAGANSTNVSGNLGWIFTAPPATSTGSFFFMFS
jgi:hypothetical protein